MTNDTAAQVIAEGLEGLQHDGDWLAERALAALAAAGYEVVKLPEADETFQIAGGEVHEDMWFASVHVPASFLEGVPLKDYRALGSALAAALLAAANASEDVS